MKLKIVCSICWICICTICSGQFIDVSNIQGIQNINEGTTYGNGISFVDFNNDGWDDLTYANGTDIPRFYVNQQGQLYPISFNISLSNSGQVTAIQWVDYDNDHDKDLMITQYLGVIHLFDNDGNMVFTNVTSIAGFPLDIKYREGVAWVDFDHDGFLDVYISKYYNPGQFPDDEYISRLYKNNGNKTFTDVTISSGVFMAPKPTFQPVWFDMNNDGWEDLYLINDRFFASNDLFKNNGNGTFTNISVSSGTNIAIDAMSGSIGDYDKDGDFDIYVSNGYDGNNLLKNNGDETFTEVATEAGVSVNAICWGGAWMDYDNNGWEDLFISATEGIYGPFPNYFFINEEDGTFIEGMETVGISEDNDPTFCVAIGDLNNDGFFDYATNNNDPVPSALWMNDGGAAHWISIDLEGTVSNTDAIGAWIQVCTSEGIQHRYTMSGENYLAQCSEKEMIGLGDQSIVDSIIVRWPRGLIEKYFNVSSNQQLHFVEGATFNNPFNIITSDSTICEGQNVILDAGEALAYDWGNGNTDRYLTITQAGTYSVVVTHEFGFTQNSSPITISAFYTAQPNANLSMITCNGLADGSISLDVSNYNLDQINWNNGMEGAEITNLAPGDYSFTLFTIEGCSAENEFTISEPLLLTATWIVENVACFGDSTGFISIGEIQGGTMPYSYSIDSPNSNQLSAGDYLVSVTDAHSCQIFQTVTIEEAPLLELILTTTSEMEGGPLGTASAEIIGGTMPYTWTWNGEQVNENFIQDLSSGDYLLSIEDFNGCSVDSLFHIDFVLGTETLEPSLLTIFPNPSKGVFHIQFPEWSIGSDCNVYSMNGSLIKKWRITTSLQSVDFSHLPLGVYTISCSNDQHYLSQQWERIID